MSNIYLDRFDRFVEQQLIPKHTRGERRRVNPEYDRLSSRKSYAAKRGDREAVRTLSRAQRAIPSKDTHDPGFRRLTYTRYADDFILGFAGPKHEAEQIKAEIRGFLRDELALELSEPKTLITHAASQAARFLGYEIRVQHRDTKITDGRRSINGVVGLFVPADAVRQRCAQYMRAGKPAFRGLMTLDTDFTIVGRYGSEYRGYVQYYLLAQNVYRLGRLRRVMEVSMFKTLALKHKSTVSAMARRYKATVATPDGPRTCFQVTVEREGRKPLVARFGGIPLKRRRTVGEINDRKFPTQMRGNELIHRLLAGQCEMCMSRTALQVHHVRKLADLGTPGQAEPSPWKQMMASRRRKTLVVCERCHHDIHAGRAAATTRK
jgi:hypothetical protein